MDISFDDFLKVDVRTAKILNVEDIEGSNKLYKLLVKVGDEERTIVAGIKNYYNKEELINKIVLIVYNLKPRKLMGIESQGMLLAVLDNNKLSLITTDKDMPSGLRVS